MFDGLQKHLIRDHGREEAALLLAGVARLEGKLVLTVREVIPVPDPGFQTKGGLFLQVDPEFLAPVIKRCRYEKASLFIAHSHPFSDTTVGFSGIDDGGERALVPRLRMRVPDRPHGALVFGRRSVAARVWLEGAENSTPIDRIRIVGERSVEFVPSNADGGEERSLVLKMHDRQVLAIGEEVQRRIYRAHVVVVGCGGIGSQVVVQLLHAGVGRLTIVDDDGAEEANRSRVVSMTPGDVAQKTAKVDIMKRYGEAVNPAVRLEAVRGSSEDVGVQRLIREADFIFCCTDNIASRVPLNRLAYQYLIPLLDMGMDLQRSGRPGEIRAAAGRVMLIQPDGPCLECMGIITGEALNREGGRRPCGDDDENPASHAASAIFLNGVVASLAVTRWLDALGAFQRERKPGLYEMFLPLHGTLKAYSLEPAVKCTLCKELRGFADDLALPGGAGGK